MWNIRCHRQSWNLHLKIGRRVKSSERDPTVGKWHVEIVFPSIFCQNTHTKPISAQEEGIGPQETEDREEQGTGCRIR